MTYKLLLLLYQIFQGPSGEGTCLQLTRLQVLKRGSDIWIFLIHLKETLQLTPNFLSSPRKKSDFFNNLNFIIFLLSIRREWWHRSKTFSQIQLSQYQKFLQPTFFRIHIFSRSFQCSFCCNFNSSIFYSLNLYNNLILPTIIPFK